MKNPLFLFIHGWGFDAEFWTPLRGQFPPEDSLAWNLGFFGVHERPTLPSGRPVIAVGHSFGLLWLLHYHPVDWHSLVSINGFTCFAARDDFSVGHAPRLLARMRRRLRGKPEAVLADFHALCGGARWCKATPDVMVLDEGLAALETWDERGGEVALALCGVSDPLIPPSMSRAMISEERIVWHPGGHLLPLEVPTWCATQLKHAARL